MVRLTDRPDMTLDVYHGRKTTNSTMFFFWVSVFGTFSIEKKSLLRPSITGKMA